MPHSLQFAEGIEDWQKIGRLTMHPCTSKTTERHMLACYMEANSRILLLASKAESPDMFLLQS